MRRPVWMLSLAIATLLGAGTAAAAGLTLGLNQSLRVRLPGVAANVVVANPTIADVAMVDSHSVIILGKGYGMTEIMVTDRTGRMLMDSRVAVVGSDEGQITLYRGPKAYSYACAGRCQAMGAEAPAQAPTGQPGAPNAAPSVTVSIGQPSPTLSTGGIPISPP